ncbi:MAG: hypothetical protein C5B59_13735 [Bacteroidetes bacterium]|nr:MAG: hypothetical protein C5B59_13735 [Bacteroidota bacterium]
MSTDGYTISRPLPIPLPFADLAPGSTLDAPLVWDGASWKNKDLPLDGIDLTGSSTDQVIINSGGSSWSVGYPTLVERGNTILGPRSSDGALLLQNTGVPIGTFVSLTGVSAGISATVIETFSTLATLRIKVTTTGTPPAAGTQLFIVNYVNAFTDPPFVQGSFAAYSSDTSGVAASLGGTVVSGGTTTNTFRVFTSVTLPASSTFHVNLLVLGD